MTLFSYILRQLALGVVIAVGGMFFIAIPGVTVAAVNKLGGAGLTILLGYLPLVLTDLLPYLLPIGYLLAVVATYGRLAADSEWTAIRMAGLHPWRSALPALVVALACSSVLGYLVHVVSPALQFAKRDYLRASIVEAFRNLSPGQTELAIGQFYLNAPKRDGNTFYDALIHIPSANKSAVRTVLADRVTILAEEHDIVVNLVNARTVYGQQDTTVGASTVKVSLDEIFEMQKKTKTSWKYQDTSTLESTIDGHTLDAKTTLYARYEVQDRWTLMCTPLLFFLLGVPTGLLMRSTTQLGALAVAVVYALVYYILSMRLSKEIGTESGVPVVLAAWAVPIVGALGGLTLSWKAFRQ